MAPIFTVKTFSSYDNTPIRYAHMLDEESDNRYCPIVFVPGLGGSVKFATSFLQQFVGPHGPVFSMDARGFGLNEAIAPKPYPESYLKDFHHFIQHLQNQALLNENCAPVIVGLSLGGIYTTLYTTQYQHPFRASVLIAPAFRPHPKLFTFKFKLQNYSRILLKGFHAKTTLPYGIQDLTRNADCYDDPNFQDPLKLPSFYLFLIEQMCKKAFSKVSQLSLPTAMIIPEQDMVCDPQAMEQAYQAIQNDQKVLLTYSELYHDVMQEPEADQHQIFADLSQWLNTIGYVPSHQPQQVYQSS